MATKQGNNGSLDSMVRAIVREEVARMFSGFSSFEDDNDEQEANVPTSLNTSGSGSSTNGSSGGRGGKRARKGKGRATNPATDKRFKQNRELDN